MPLLTLAVAGLAACGGGSAAAGSAASVGSAASAESPPPAGPPATTALPVAPTAVPAGGDLDSRCADALDDGAGHDLAGVELVRADGVLVTAFTLTAPPVSGPSFLTVELHDTGGAAARQLGIELDGAEPVAAYIATSASAPVQRLDGTVHVVGAEVHAAFPAAVLDDLGAPWGWLASIGTESAVEDVCATDGTAASAAPVIVP